MKYSPSTMGFYNEAIHSYIPEDAEDIQAEFYSKLMAGQPLDLTAEQRRDALRKAVQAHLDKNAQAKGYDNIITAVSYAEEPAEPTYQTEGQAYRQWRSLVWKTYTELVNNTNTLPAPEELISALPILDLPA